MQNESSSHQRRKRKFPGPAGILPDINPDKIFLLSKKNPLSAQVSEIISSCAGTENISLEIVSSQSSQSDKEQNLLMQPSWMEMQMLLRLEEGKLDAGTLKERRLADLMNIKWILTKALVLPLGNRVPFLVAILDSVPEIPSTSLNQRKTQCIQLRDSSGSIEAALDPNIVIQYGKELHRGTALALKNVGLMFHKRKLIVTITEKNLIFLTSSEQIDGTLTDGFSKSVNKSTKSFNCVKPRITDSGVRVFKFCDYMPDKLMDIYNRISDPQVIRQRLSDLNKNSTNINRTGLVMPKPPLFSNISMRTSEDSQDIDFNFDDDDEGDEFFVGLNDEEVMGAADSGKSSKTNFSIANGTITDDHLANAKPNGNSLQSDHQILNTTPEMEDDEFDMHLASLNEGSETIGCPAPSVRETPSTTGIDVTGVFEDDFSDIVMEIENF